MQLQQATLDEENTRSTNYYRNDIYLRGTSQKQRLWKHLQIAHFLKHMHVIITSSDKNT